MAITLLASGYSVSFLRESSGLGKAVAYIRPLQKLLNMAVAKDVFKVSLTGLKPFWGRGWILCQGEISSTVARDYEPVRPQVAQVRNMSIDDHWHCCLPFEI